MEELKDLREKIDAIDQQMVDLFKQRMEVSKEVAAYKQEHGLPTLDAGRERALLAKVGSLAGEDLADYTESVFRSIMAASRSYQKQCEGSGSPVYEGIRTALSTTPDLFPQRATVACQGIEGLIPRSPAIVSLNPPPSSILTPSTCVQGGGEWDVSVRHPAHRKQHCRFGQCDL